jgi:hypothetical protein
VAVLQKTEHGIERFFKTASGYVVLPIVAGIGGAVSSAILFEGGNAVGKSSLAEVTTGLQLGGRDCSEIVFFGNATTLPTSRRATSPSPPR